MNASNTVNISGYLTSDPRVTYSGNDNQRANARFSVGIRRKFKNAEGNYDSDFPSVVCWNNTAKFVEKYFHKGDAIKIVGELRTGNYKNKNTGATVYYTEVWADDVSFGDKASSSGGDNGNAQSGGNTGSRNNYNGNNNNYGGNNGQNFINIPEGVDESLPFN